MHLMKGWIIVQEEEKDCSYMMATPPGGGAERVIIYESEEDAEFLLAGACMHSPESEIPVPDTFKIHDVNSEEGQRLLGYWTQNGGKTIMNRQVEGKEPFVEDDDEV